MSYASMFRGLGYELQPNHVELLERTQQVFQSINEAGEIVNLVLGDPGKNRLDDILQVFKDAADECDLLPSEERSQAKVRNAILTRRCQGKLAEWGKA